MAFAGMAQIRKPAGTTSVTNEGYQFLQMDVVNLVAPTSSAVTWYADNIAGYSSIDFYGMGVSTGSVPTTISAQPLFGNGTNCGSAQTITSGTDLTDIRSAYYKFTLPASTVTRNVSFNFVIAD